MKFNSPKSQIMNINWNIAKLNEELSLRIKRWMEELEDYYYFFLEIKTLQSLRFDYQGKKVYLFFMKPKFM